MPAAFSRHGGQISSSSSWWQPCCHGASAGPAKPTVMPVPNSVTRDQEPGFSPQAPGDACASEGHCSLGLTDAPVPLMLTADASPVVGLSQLGS